MDHGTFWRHSCDLPPAGMFPDFAVVVATVLAGFVPAREAPRLVMEHEE